MAIPVSHRAMLEQMGLFHGLSATDLDYLMEAGHLRLVEKDSFFFHQGDNARFVYALTQGQVKMTQVNLDGQETFLQIASPGMMFGAVAALPNTVYPVSSMAIEDAQAMAWSQENIQHLSKMNPQLLLSAMQQMSTHVQEMQQRFQELANERVERRIARALLRLANQAGKKIAQGVLIDFPLSRQDLAEMTGTTLYSVSRILSEWERQGLVETGRERVIIKFPHGLVKIAEE